jgi:hypothetical protein
MVTVLPYDASMAVRQSAGILLFRRAMAASEPEVLLGLDIEEARSAVERLAEERG